MNPSEKNEPSLEAILRRSPAPRPPASLEKSIVEKIQLTTDKGSRVAPPGSNANAVPGRPSGWRRWWPVLLPAAAAAAFATSAVVQQVEISDLRDELQRIEQRQSVPQLEPAAVGAPSTSTVTVPDEREEIVRLRALVESLTGQVAAIDALRAENDRLRASIASAVKAMPADLREWAEAGDKAKRIRCVNNMKQLGLAVRIFANDNSEEFPPDITAMTNELSTPKILVCPADETRHPAENWSVYTAANCTYEFLSAGPGKFEGEPQRVMFRCPVHGTVTLCDGSVQQLDVVKNPARLTHRNGGIYVYEEPPPQGAPFQMSPEMRKRYGLGGADNGSAPAGADAASEALRKRYGLAPGSVVVTSPGGPGTAAESSEPAQPAPARQP